MDKFTAFAKLINELLTNPDEFESQSFTVSDNGDVNYGHVTIQILKNGEYLVTSESHYNCDSAHVSCRLIEEITIYPYEALEMAVTR